MGLIITLIKFLLGMALSVVIAVIIFQIVGIGVFTTLHFTKKIRDKIHFTKILFITIFLYNTYYLYQKLWLPFFIVGVLMQFFLLRFFYNMLIEQGNLQSKDNRNKNQIY